MRILGIDARAYPSVQPKLHAVMGSDGEISDVRISYPLDLTSQMLEYSDATRTSRDDFRAGR